ncbi:hypothetical protein [Arthrobacter sunyaminii]|uniref:Uncharacterized protein n=1 Tax=Arthrobacter sunyaminii TaxID=2816859 RepID=A0A975S803_9MICC|nr:hypothetical protein [Arthrobacter sunyaminii]MBO0906738.1 hypothetical protein [Arthrobacter sunyaminii]QWQ37513.1 hypothetical protein KG104_07220 [Arthrobacter sunyaminii]
MNAETQPLLAGPRGRRLCLELAMELNPDVSLSVSRLGYELDPGKGTSRMLFGLMTPEETNDDDARPPAVGSSGDLAARLATLDLSCVTDELVQPALERSVDAARYWQPPEGEDVLASMPIIRKALVPLAARVMATPSMQRSTEARRMEQWAIDWRGPDDPAPLDRAPQPKLAQWGRNIRADEGRWRANAYGLDSNMSGDWWSIPPGLVGTVGRIPAGLNLIEDPLGWEDATTIAVRGAGRTYEIRTGDDWTALCRKFPLEVTASRRNVWFQVTGRDGRWLIPDWERVAGEWDAVHLSILGYLSTAGRVQHIDEEWASMIAGWDPDRTIWLTDAVREIDRPRQYWHRAQHGDAWTLVRRDGVS